MFYVQPIYLDIEGVPCNDGCSGPYTDVAEAIKEAHCMRGSYGRCHFLILEMKISYGRMILTTVDKVVNNNERKVLYWQKCGNGYALYREPYIDGVPTWKFIASTTTEGFATLMNLWHGSWLTLRERH
jgi:hypothetical protein